MRNQYLSLGLQSILAWVQLVKEWNRGGTYLVPNAQEVYSVSTQPTAWILNTPPQGNM
ncbi:MAG: hypothetical protein AAFQ98_15205 [Bacteroidota bacterium]